MVIKMLKDVELFIALIFLLIGVILIFNARYITKSKLESQNENVAVNILKILGYLLCVFSLVFAFYIN